VLEVAEMGMAKGVEANGQAMQKHIGFLMLAYMDPGQRYDLMERIMDEPLAADLLVSFVGTGYIAPDDARSLVAVQINQYNIQKEGTRKRKEVEAIDAEIAKLNNAIGVVNSDAMENRLDYNQAVREETLKRYKKLYGHKNYAASAFQVENIIGAYATMNGALTILVNVAANYNDPLSLPTNPALQAGFVMLGIGTEIGQGGVMGMSRKPHEALLYSLRDTGDEEDQRSLAMQEQMATKLSTNAKEAKAYHMLAPEINLAYSELRIAQGKTEVTLTGADGNLDYYLDQLPDEYRPKTSADRESLLETWSEWSREFYLSSHMGRKTATSQRKFIEDSLKTDIPTLDLTPHDA